MTSNRTLAMVCLMCTMAAAALGLLALVKGIQLEGTPTANAEAAHGQRIGVPALIAFASGVAGMLLQQRTPAIRVCTGLAVVSLAISVVFLLLG